VTQVCELVSVEAQLDRIEAELARELPAHMRAFAEAYARDLALPSAPSVLGRRATLATARAALAHPFLADRGLALLRLAAPIAIEADAAVIAARASLPSWESLGQLAAARDAASVALLGLGAIDAMHRLHGVAAAAEITGAPPALAPPVAGWFAADGTALDDPAIARACEAICAQHGVAGTVRWQRASGARPRTFVVVPRSEVVVVIPAQIATPAARFAVLHELGHAVAALGLAPGIPRVIDEAAAAYVARAIERAGQGRWSSAVAVAARHRRSALARRLDRLERALPTVVDRPAERPPWALWHDPAAQAAYVAAEQLADELDRTLGAAPAPGALIAALEAARMRVDQRSALGW
jgi:hypothetical protein